MEEISPMAGCVGPEMAVPRSGLDDAAADGVAHQSGRLVDAELRHDARPVRLGSLDADSEKGGDLLRGLPLRDQLQDLAFPRAERIGREVGLVAVRIAHRLR